MSLTDVKVRTAKTKDKPYKLSDEKGLYLLITRHQDKERKETHCESKTFTL